jgi:phosphoribosyl 1,2-cyclic phosphodiesterase
LRLHICGVRGSTPSPGADFARYGGHTSCVAVSHDGEPPSLVLDAGTGLRRLTALLDGAPFRGSILLGHLHWDHTQGLPFFGAGDRPDARTTLVMPEQGDPVDVMGRAMSPPHFPIGPTELRGEWHFAGLSAGHHVIEGFDVLALDIPHKGGRTFGYRVSDGRSAIAYLSDHGPSQLGPGPDGFGPYHEAALELADGVDLLVHDAQHTAAELPAVAHFGHSAADYPVRLAELAGAHTVLLFHHDPNRTDDQVDALVASFQGRDVEVTGAAEGTTHALGV